MNAVSRRAHGESPSILHFVKLVAMRTYRRLMGFLRPYRKQLWGSLAFAWAAMGMTVLIPLLIGHTVNEIEEGSRGQSHGSLLLLAADAQVDRYQLRDSRL